MKVCVALPSKNNERTIGNIIENLLKSKYRPKIIVIDGFSQDRTREIASSFENVEVLTQSEKIYPGKGVAMKDGILKAIEESCDILAFFDADIKNFEKSWLEKLVEKIESGVDMARGYYERRARDAPVTKLVARPLLSLFFPEISQINQPLSGEVAAKIEVWKELVKERDIPKGWGIDIWFLIETAMKGFSISEVFLGFKNHTSFEKYENDVEPLKEMARQIEITIIKEAVKYGRIKRVEELLG